MHLFVLPLEKEVDFNAKYSRSGFDSSYTPHHSVHESEIPQSTVLKMSVADILTLFIASGVMIDRSFPTRNR